MSLTNREHVAANALRYQPGSSRGHYESYFLRANHPQRPQAFWIRYTIFSPRKRPSAALGELWAIYFDGESGKKVAVKREFPLACCDFSSDRLRLRIDTAELDESGLHGRVNCDGHDVAWDLRYGGGAAPLFLLPQSYYGKAFPKAKALVSQPNAHFGGQLQVDGEAVLIDDWVGSQNHNWGSKHTDQYAWGQVAGFDGAPDSFLECSTARVRVGPFFTPWMTLLVLRLDGVEYAINGLFGAMRAQGRYQPFDWHFEVARAGIKVRGRIHALHGDFVALRYYNPPGGAKICLNSKIASCELVLEREGQAKRLLRCRRRAAFEIIRDEPVAGVPLAACR